MSHIVFWADLTVLRLFTTVRAKVSKKLISPRILCISNTNRVLSWFDRFTAFYNCMTKMSQISYLCKFCAQISKIVLLADLTVLRLTRTVWAKMSQNTYLREFWAQVSQIVFLADLTVLWLVTTVWGKILQNSYLHEFLAQLSQIVFLADLTVLRLVTTVWAKNIKKLISPRVCCTIVTNRVPSWFHRFTAFYNCIRKNVIRLITPRVFCTSVKKLCS